MIPPAVRYDHERLARRKLFKTAFAVLSVVIACLLFWKLKALLLPIVVGALLAYLFRPLKDRFQISWLPHELRVLTLFACVGLGLFVMAHQMRKMVPDEKQKLELKVRLKYKLNDKFQELVGTHNPEKHGGAIAQLISREAGPMMDKLNALLDLDPSEIERFEQYRAGYKGQPPIEPRFVDYFLANQTTNVYTALATEQASVTSAADNKKQGSGDGAQDRESLMEEVSIWILVPVIFFFLGFDNGQLRRYIISLVPNRYFELSLTVMDELDEAIGKYLRGT